MHVPFSKICDLKVEAFNPILSDVHCPITINIAVSDACSNDSNEVETDVGNVINEINNTRTTWDVNKASEFRENLDIEKI